MAFHGMIGRKVGMTQIFDDAGHAVPVTVIELGPNPIVQIRNEETDGYQAVQVGFGHRREVLINKPEAGHLKKANQESLRHLREFRVDDVEGLEVGHEFTVADMEGMEFVDVSATSKGCGFAGVMKRHNMKGAATKTHGTHEFFRHAGSIGNRAFPGRVWKGKRMAGHMGAERVTVQNLKVARIDAERNLLLVRGGVPGPRNGLVEVRAAVKKS